jgi:hypothetical protein
MGRRASFAYAIGLLALAVLLVRSLFAVPYLPTNDGPEHVMASHMENHFADPGTLYADRLKPAAEYAARGFALLYSPLENWLGWRLGLQWALALIALTAAFGFVALVRATQPGRWPIAFLGFPLALTWELYMGFFPFTVGSGVGLLVLALGVAWREPTGLKRFVLGFLLLLQAVCHVFTAVLTGIVLAALFLSRAPRGQRWREAVNVSLMGLPAAGILLASALARQELSQPKFAQQFLVLPLRITIGSLPRIIAPGPWWRALAAVALLAASFIVGGRRVRKREMAATDQALFFSGLAFVLAGVLCPMNIPGWQFFSPRFVPLGVLLCLVTLPFETLKRPVVARALAAGSFLFSATWLVASSPFHRRLAAACDDAIAGLSAPVRRRAIWLPIAMDSEGKLPVEPTASEVPFLMPLTHMPMLYALVEGGLTPYQFGMTSATYPFTLREGGPPLPPLPPNDEFDPIIESHAFDEDTGLRHRVENALATYGMFYEGVLVMGARPDDHALFQARGFVDEWTQGSVFIGHFVPCLLDVIIPLSGDAPLLDLGVGPQTILGDQMLPSTLEGDGTRHVRFQHSPCGEVWVRPHWDKKKADGTVARSFCKNAGRAGDIAATLTRSFAKVTCEGLEMGL